MPVRNCRSTIDVAIRSIRDQTFGDWELLVLDDGSTDGTPLVVEKHLEDPRIHLIADGRARGITTRLNQAISMSSKSTFFARMDGDDVSYPTRLERQVRILEEDRDSISSEQPWWSSQVQGKASAGGQPPPSIRRSAPVQRPAS